ncbi:MAG: DUF5694 domain-containing protein [Psychrobium sp.]
MKQLLLIFALIGLLPKGVAAKASTIEELKPLVKAKTQVMILATTHLRAVKSPLTFDDLAPVVKKLNAFSPTAIAVESLRPIDILTMELQGEAYTQVLSQFIGRDFLDLSVDVRKSLQISAIEAMNELNESLDKKSFTNAWHQQVLRLATAANDKSTALLHYAYLSTESKPDMSKLSEPLIEYFEALFERNNEIKLLAINLALKLKLAKLESIDDHLDKDQYMSLVPKLIPSFKKSTYIDELKNSDYVKKPMQLTQKATENGDWLALYEWINNEPYQAQVINTEWRAFVDKDLDSVPAIARIALWEVRNLNMVSHIMRVVSDHSGEKVLVIVGASHKRFFDEYLSRMIGVEVINF